MGKEWNWVGKSSKRSVIVEENHETTPSGCMCAVFQFFDFHHFSNSINHQQQITFKSPSSTTKVPKVSGGEAPRNSLESEDSIVLASLSKEEKFKVPNIQIKTKRSNGGIFTDLSSEISTSSSPGTKTPTLVARLMGLDILPNSNSPSFSSPLSTLNSQGKNNIIQHLHQLKTKPRNSIDGSEISRVPSSRKSDFDQHRLSLQINKENYSLGDDDFELPRLSFSKRKIDENSSKSSSHYAKQIVKQVKESVVSRKVGQDITNNLKSMQDINIKQNTRVTKKLPSNDELQGREEFLGQLRVKKCPKASSSKDTNPNSSSSPKIRFIDNKHKPNTRTKTSKNQNTKPKTYALKQEQESKDKKLVSSNCKKATNEKFSSRFKRPPQTSDIIARPTSNSRANDIKSNTKCKKTQPLSSNLVNNFNAVSNVDSVKTESSPLSNKIPQKQKQSQVSETQVSKLQRYKPEFQYIAEIINKHVTTTKAMSFHKLFSSTHSLDPSVFIHLEQNSDDKDRIFATKNQLGHRWNRKLMFDLVDEVLMEILKPKSSKKKLCFLDEFCEKWTVMELTENVWKRVKEFPCAKCEVLDDIDNLIGSEDMEKVIKFEGEDEREELVREIEGNILNTLVHETILVMSMIE